MSTITALARAEEAVSPLTPPIDLCRRIVARSYNAHQQVQESINQEWADFLLG